MTFQFGMKVDLLRMTYMLMFVSMTLTLIQVHNRSAEENNINVIETAHGARRMHDLLYAHVPFDNLDLVLDFENVC